MCLGRSEVVGCIELGELPHLIRHWFKRATIVIVAKCRVEYVGRASSKASSAWRLIIIKEDGTVLIHGPEGRNPMNWQPKARVIAKSINSQIVIEAIRQSPREVLKIYIEEGADVMISRLGKGKFQLIGSEKEFTDLIASNPELIEEGAKLVSREVTTPHGRVDVILRSRDGSLILVEVKRSMVDVDAVYQLNRYVKYYESLGIRVKGVLASPSISPTAEKLAAKLGFKHVAVSLSKGKRGGILT